MAENEQKVGPGNPPKETQFQPGESGNPDGRPKGRKSLKTIIRELAEDDDFDWSLVPLKDPDRDKARVIGSPWKAIVMTAVAKAVAGDVKAMRWLQQAGYGDKLDITSDDQPIVVAPVVLPNIKKRYVRDQAETTDSD